MAPVLVSVGVLATAGFGVFDAWLLSCGFEGCPTPAQISAFRPAEGARVLDRNGKLIGRLNVVRRVNVSLQRVPVHVRQAFIATEDRRFYRHGGIDLRGFARASVRNARTLSVREGFSTISMQLARNTFLAHRSQGDRSFSRKLLELRVARLIENTLTKDQILERIVCNSRNVAGRVKKYYGRDAIVVYPPVDTGRFAYKGDEGFWLSINRLYPEKRIELQLRAFEQMPEERLVIVGNSGGGDHSAAYAKKLRALLPPNVSILSDLPEDELIDLYGRCRGLIATPADEDFGMGAVEAMASGKPVIAVREGGYLETVVDEKTGMLIDADSDSIVKAVKEVSRSPSKYREACVEQARKFDVGVFISRMRAMIQ
jgi:glycosyltransferase involved in cell wall biosynthesis